MPGGTDFIQKVVHKRNRDPHKDESTHRMSAKFPILSDLRMSHRDVELGRVSDNRKIFGTDGVRGVANVEPVTAETALKLGRAAAHVFLKLNPRAHPGGTRPKIVLGKDTRLSGYMLENALVAGITSLGVDVLVIGPLPTPGVAYITRSLRADAGIVLSASHNPYADNGIKFFRHDGYKLDDQVETQIAARFQRRDRRDSSYSKKNRTRHTNRRRPRPLCRVRQTKFSARNDARKNADR